jgi:hypothetical protein
MEVYDVLLSEALRKDTERTSNMDEIVLLWRDSFALPEGHYLRDRILKFYSLEKESEFRTYVEGRDEEKYDECERDDPSDCLVEFAERDDVWGLRITLKRVTPWSVGYSLFVAAQRGNRRAVKILAINGSVVLHAISEALTKQDDKTLKVLVPFFLERATRQNLKSLFQVSVQFGNVELVETARKALGLTYDEALVSATGYHAYGVIKYFVEKGANSFREAIRREERSYSPDEDVLDYLRRQQR